MITRLYRSFKYTRAVTKISQELGKNCMPGSRLTADSLFDDKFKRQKLAAMQDMRNLWEENEILAPVVQYYGENSDDLEKLYQLIMLNGGGQWIKGYFLPVAALCFPKPLEFVLRNRDRLSLIELISELIEYLEQGNPYLPIQ